MPSFSLEQVCVDLPVLGHHARSLKLSLVATATGGRLARESGVTIVRALREITLAASEGDRIGLAGPNGAGKTTLLRTIVGAYPPVRGRRQVDGAIASLIDPASGIEPEATGWENIGIRALLMGIGRRTLVKARREIAEFSGLGDYLALPVRTYSTGMSMRLAFSIVTHFPAEILLLDEWLSVGDAEFRRHAEARMRSLVDRSGILVLASHSNELLARECRRRIELSEGRIVSDRRTEPVQPSV